MMSGRDVGRGRLFPGGGGRRCGIGAVTKHFFSARKFKIADLKVYLRELEKV